MADRSSIRGSETHPQLTHIPDARYSSPKLFVHHTNGRSAQGLGARQGRCMRDEPALKELYESLPAIECAGKCWGSCGGNVGATPVDIRRTQRAGLRLREGHLVTGPDGRPYGTVCNALDRETKRCRVYDVRPILCRLWGLFPEMACPWGCVPEGGLMDTVEALRVLSRAQWYGGTPGALPPAQIDAALSQPEHVALLRMQLSAGKPVREEPHIETRLGTPVILSRPTL
ncbi:YkgJ family cysteine cluster protein [Streptomyces griseoviridis]|uniref:YkgJ family cysteine cluster protein n=1 Tax=Streptomyces griseoviridis TaxID=45398 RepID=UPI00344B0B1C